jgi:hypothetical protein
MNLYETKTPSDYEPLRLSGVAPNVLRELSGIYPSFVSAFKELVNNAYDADATEVKIWLATDLSRIKVEDNGRGMTLFEFQDNYVRIGGSVHHRENTDLTTSGRRPIGRKGIGFLAIARYCHSIEIDSYANKEISVSRRVLVEPQPDPVEPRLIPFFAGPFVQELAPFITVQNVQYDTTELSPTDYSQRGIALKLSEHTWRSYEGNSLTIHYSIDWRKVKIQATIDYEYLLNLGDEHNLSTLKDFCLVRILPISEEKKETFYKARPRNSFTCVMMNLRDFVQRELQEPKRSGWVRNMASSSGQERFLWNLSRSVPVAYHLDSSGLEQCGLELLDVSTSPTPFTLEVKSEGDESRELKRPLFGEIADIDGVDCDDFYLVKHPIRFESNGVKAQGYLLGRSQPIFPAELRGIAIRVRGVEIGKPNFLSVENSLPIKYRPLLNQIMGEIIVLEGLDAITAIVPGREGFYTENARFQILRKQLVGDGKIEFGALGQVLKQLWERSRVESSARRILQKTSRRRKAFLDVSQAITMLAINSHYGRSLRRLFSCSDIVANGLSNVPEYETGLPATIADYTIELMDLPDIEFQLDVERKIVQLNNNTETWTQPLSVLNRDFQISLRNGKPNDPICEIDFSTGTIYLNWLHPTRREMGDTLFVKSAIFWRIAYLAADGDVDLMMNLAHQLISLSI